MKSKLPERTSCKGCIFATLGKTDILTLNGEHQPPLADEQNGCAANRIWTFSCRNEAHRTHGNQYFQLTRFCNMYRDDEWRKETQEKYEEPFSFLEDLVSSAEQEVMPLFGIAIQDHPDSTLEDLRATLKSIGQLDYPRKKIKVVISTFSARGLNDVMHEVNVLRDKGYLAEAIFHVVFEPVVKDAEVFKKLTQSHYFVNAYSGAVLDKDVFKTVDTSLNKKLEKIIIFENEGWYSIVRKAVVTSLYLEFNNYEKTIDHIRTISQERGVYQKV